MKPAKKNGNVNATSNGLVCGVGEQTARQRVYTCLIVVLTHMDRHKVKPNKKIKSKVRLHTSRQNVQKTHGRLAYPFMETVTVIVQKCKTQLEL